MTSKCLAADRKDTGPAPATLRVLIVGDGQAVREHFLPVLHDTRSALEVRMAAADAFALKTLGERTWDLVLLDVERPDARNLETLAAIRERFPRLPLVVCMGSGALRQRFIFCLKGTSARVEPRGGSIENLIHEAVSREEHEDYWSHRAGDLRRLLVVNDDAETRDAVEGIFADTDIGVDHVAGATDALARLRDGYGVVLTDTGLPGMNGVDWIRQMRQIDPLVEVIALAAGFDFRSVAERSARLGAFATVARPLADPERLRDLVEQAVARRRQSLVDELLSRGIAAIGLEPGPDGSGHGPATDGNLGWHLFESLNDGVVLLDAAGSIRLANLRFARLLDLAYPAAFGRPFPDFMVPTDRDVFARLAADVRRVGRRVDEIHLVTRTGLVLTVMVTARRILTERGEDAALLVINDLTELRRVQGARILAQNAALKQANAELEQFAFITSHDLQEPLRGIVVFAGALRRDLGEDLPERARKDLGFLIDSAKRMQALVGDLLELAHTSTADLDRRRVSMEACAGEALGRLAHRIRETGAEIRCDPLPELWGDPTLLTQVYQNLIDNALKFAGQVAPEVHLTAEQCEGEWVLGVKDRGIGISREFADRVFAPGKRLHRRCEIDGTGIGLAICRKALERLGGRIWVDPDATEGTHVKFTLDYMPEDRDLVERHG